MLAIFLMKATQKAKPDKAKTELQASTDPPQRSASETPAKPKRGFKRPPDKLDWIIRLVNSLPSSPPQVTSIPKRMDDLQPELRAYLDSEYESAMLDDDGYHAVERMQSAYLMVLDMNEALRQLMREANEVSDEETTYFHQPVDAGAYLEITRERTVRVRMSQLAQAIEGIEIDYLRYCDMCRKIFYAGRKNQQCCTPKCAKAQRQKRWRQRYKDGETGYYK